MERDLKNDIWIIWKILLNCKENFLFSRYLHKPDSREELAYLKHSRHFQFLRHSLWRLCIIELHKLVSKSSNDTFNLWTFIRNLETDNYLGHNVPVETVVDWKKYLFSQKGTIKKISVLRNKLYAHTDLEGDKIVIDISFEDVYKVILIAEKVISGIYLKSFDSGTIMEAPLFDREHFDIIKILAKEENERIETIMKWGSPK